MLRGLAALLLATGMASAVGAATLAVAPDKLTYNIGETVTLTVTGDDQDAMAYGVYGRLVYNGALVDNNTRSQVKLVAGPFNNWVTGTLTSGDTNANAATSAFSEAFNQISFPSADTANNLPGTLSTVTLIAAAGGIVPVNWFTESGSGLELTFFGLYSAAGTSFTIVPEPASAALLALGLLALARPASRVVSSASPATRNRPSRGSAARAAADPRRPSPRRTGTRTRTARNARRRTRRTRGAP